MPISRAPARKRAKFGLRPDDTPSVSGSPMLLYLNFHGIGDPGRPFEPGEEAVWVGREAFLGMLDALRDMPDARITFDDGNRSDIEIALPELHKRGLKAWFFVCTGRIGRPGFLDVADIRELRDAGMSIGSHGHDHVPWVHLAPDRARVEWPEAKARIEEIVGQTVDEAACPFGSFGRGTFAGLRNAGFRVIHTCDRQLVTERDPVKPRFAIHRWDTGASVRSWLEPPPLPGRLFRRMKSLVKGYL